MVETGTLRPGKDWNTMKSSFIRIFALAMLANSILAFGASSPRKDDKMPAPCSPPAASSPQSTEDQHCDKQMKKEKKMKKKSDEHKSNEHQEDENYPGYGIFG
jgi:hypothetical protein